MEKLAKRQEEIKAQILALEKELNGDLSPGLYSVHYEHRVGNLIGEKVPTEGTLGILTVSGETAYLMFLNGGHCCLGNANRVTPVWLSRRGLKVVGKLEQIDLDPEKEHHGGL